MRQHLLCHWLSWKNNFPPPQTFHVNIFQYSSLTNFQNFFKLKFVFEFFFQIKNFFWKIKSDLWKWFQHWFTGTILAKNFLWYCQNLFMSSNSNFFLPSMFFSIIYWKFTAGAYKSRFLKYVFLSFISYQNEVTIKYKSCNSISCSCHNRRISNILFRFVLLMLFYQCW